jgi:hypothetical protein
MTHPSSISGARYLIGLLCLGLSAGCSRGSDRKLVAADGSVTYKGKPLAGAAITFVPEKGPLAMGITDVDGNFKLNTGALPGVAVGPARVSIAIGVPGSATDSSSKSGDMTTDPDGYRKRMLEMQATAPADGAVQTQSLIPERYTKHDTNELKYTIKAEGNNHFNIELKD